MIAILIRVYGGLLTYCARCKRNYKLHIYPRSQKAKFPPWDRKNYIRFCTTKKSYKLERNLNHLTTKYVFAENIEKVAVLPKMINQNQFVKLNRHPIWQLTCTVFRIWCYHIEFRLDYVLNNNAIIFHLALF